jgi:hypothetical protein
MRRTITILVAGALAVGACGSPGASSAPPGSAEPSTSPAPTPTGPPTAQPSPAAGRWVGAGTMAIGRAAPHAVLLGDGTVLVVGNDEPGCVRVDMATTEIWDPSSNSWSPGAILNSLRSDFVSAALVAGRALVTGGIGDDESVSSTYVYDPRGDPPVWARSGDLGTARAYPVAAVLLDGRILVAGGVHHDGTEGLVAPVSSVALAAYRPQPPGRTAPRPPLDDMVPPVPVPVLATAELYDPGTGAWSATGPLRFARLGAAAVTLADGRVLVVGSRKGGYLDNTEPIVHDGAFASAEVYDPATGTFSPVDDLPATDWSPVADLDPLEHRNMWTIDPGRTLVALADGGALLFDKAVEWYGKDNMEGRIVRTLRFDPAAGSWTVIDVRVWQHKATGDPPAPMVEVVAGHSRSEPLVARLADGRILVAGGVDGATVGPSTEADLYDPATDTWTTLPPMPEPRSGGAAVALPDGSILLVGGDGVFDDCPLVNAGCECGEGITGLASAVRFVPEP